MSDPINGNGHEGRELAVLKAAERRLAECTELDEVLAIQSEAEMIRTYARKQRLGLQMQNQAARIKLQAERKLGKTLSEMHLRGGDRKSNSHRESLIVLQDLGIDHNQSSRWQREASISDEEFEAFCQELESRGAEICTRALLQFVRARRRTHRSVHRRKKRRIFVDLDSASRDSFRDDDSRECAETLTELRNHLESLASMFADICGRKSSDLERVEKQQIPRYLRDISKGLEALEAYLQNNR